MQCSRSLRRLLITPQAQLVVKKSPRRCIHATRWLYAAEDKTPNLKNNQQDLAINQTGETSIAPSSTAPKQVVWKQTTQNAEYKDHLLKADDLSVTRGRRKKRMGKRTARHVQPYTEADLKNLEQYYSPQQMAALRAGEASIDPRDIVTQGALHQGPMTLNYLDDFSDIRPAIDKNPEQPSFRDPKTGKMPKFRWKEDDELVNDLEDWLDEQPEDGGDMMNMARFFRDHKSYVSDVDWSKAPNFVAPELPVIDDPIMQSQARASKSSSADREEMEEEYKKLAKQLGIGVAVIKSYTVKFLVTRRVTNQTRLGKRLSMYFLTIAGNGNGLLGIGEGKSQEASDARKKAITDALRNMVPIRRYEDRTIYGSVKGKSGATELELHARHPGFGSRCQSLIWEMCKAAGIKDISARVTRSRNPMNIVKATMNALRSQQDPDEIAMARGRRMVDLRKVYYAGGNA